MTPTGTTTVRATLTTQPTVSCGLMTIKYDILSAASGGSVLVNNKELTSGTPTNGVFSTTLYGSFFDGSSADRPELQPGWVVRLVAGFTPGDTPCQGGAFPVPITGFSPTTDLLIVAGTASPCGSEQTTGVKVGINNPNGIGQPVPGTSSAWAFDVTITACEHVYNVTAQGGDNGWGFIKECQLQEDATDADCSPRKPNNRNTVWLWTVGTNFGNSVIGELLAGQQVAVRIRTEGTIKNSSSECGAIKKLNGNWSALYATTPGGPKTKSDYSSYQAMIQVTCN